MKGGLLLDVVARQGATVHQLLAGEDQALLVSRDAFIVLDFLLDILDGVPALHKEGYGLASQGLDEYIIFHIVGLRSRGGHLLGCLGEDLLGYLGLSLLCEDGTDG